ncbi:hypothetical protein [Flagellimonas sp.]|uniref:hypothetical protein n=1 Tax=Flagellimonas sp. TaxID=2058762 RepID=UPI003B51C1B0
MKKMIAILSCLLLMGLSCKKKTDSEESKSDTIEVGDSHSDSSDSAEAIKDCDDFLASYEEWTDDYLEFLGKYKDNPAAALSDKQYSEMLMRASSWSSDWVAIATSCAGNPRYESRFSEISDNMDEKLKDMGFK